MYFLGRKFLLGFVLLTIAVEFQTFAQTEEAPSFEFGVDTIIQSSYSDIENLKKVFKEPNTPNGFSVLLIKNFTPIGFGLSYTIAEAELKMETDYNNEVLIPTFRSSYNIFNLVIDLATTYTNLSIYLGAGQYSLSCQSDDNDCSKKVFKDAEFPSSTFFSSGGRISLNMSSHYRIYFTYIYVNNPKVLLKQKKSDDIPNPETIEYDPSVSLFNVGFGFSF